MKKILLFFYLLSISCFSQTKIDEQRSILIAFNYLNNQKETIKHIKNNFPELSNACDLAVLNFDTNYAYAKRNIYLKVQEIYQDGFASYLSMLNSNLKSYFQANKMARKESLSYIKQLNMRAKGSIETPIKKTLNEYQSIELDLIEITQRYEVISYTQNQKFEFSIEVPKNWKSIEDSSSNALKMFRSNFGTGSRIITVHKINNPNKVSFMTKKALMSSIPLNSYNVIISKEIINDELIHVIDYDEINPIALSNEKRKVKRFYLFKGQNIFVIACSVYPTQSEQLSTFAEKSTHLFKSIAASIKYTNSNKTNTLVKL